MGKTSRAFGKLPQILTFPFKGEGWFGKLAIAALIMISAGIIPILPTIILLGYFYEMVRRIVVDGEDASLPNWDDWGAFLSNGFKWFASSLVIVLPFVVIFGVMMALYFVPLAFINDSGANEFMAGYFAFLFILQFILIFGSMIFMVFMGVFAPVYMTHMAAEGEFKAMFQIKAWWKVFTKGFWEFLISFLLMYGLGMIIYLIFFVLLYSVVCCCLAPFAIGFGAVYLMAVYFALIASAYRDGSAKVQDGDEPEPDDPKLKGDFKALPEPDGEQAQVETSEEIAEFDLPSPDGEDATLIAVESGESEEDATMLIVEEVSEPQPESDATVVSDVNQEVAVVMGFAEATVKMNDLKKINGIGPKTADILKQNGILTFAHLAETPVERLKEILVANDLEVVAAACEDWPQQAKELL